MACATPTAGRASRKGRRRLRLHRIGRVGGGRRLSRLAHCGRGSLLGCLRYLGGRRGRLRPRRSSTRAPPGSWGCFRCRFLRCLLRIGMLFTGLHGRRGLGRRLSALQRRATSTWWHLVQTPPFAYGGLSTAGMRTPATPVSARRASDRISSRSWAGSSTHQSGAWARNISGGWAPQPTAITRTPAARAH